MASPRRLALPLLLAFVVAAPLALLAPAGAQTLTTPTFAHHEPPNGWGVGGAEPSVGVNWNTGAIMTINMLRTLRLDVSGATPVWTDVSAFPTTLETFDPILFTDPVTGRTFVSQLILGCSLMAFTDDDGATWTPVSGSPLLPGTGASMGCAPGAAFDHQTVGGGPFPLGFTGAPGGYPHAVYYCAHNGIVGMCGMSLDGGLTFLPATPLETYEPCASIHGHVKVSPADGTAFVPIGMCSQSLTDGTMRAGISVAPTGVAWTPSVIPGTGSQFESDSSVAVAQDGTVYYCYQGGDGRLGAVVSHDNGATWSAPTSPGAALNIRNVQFPAMVAGDGDRAACAFLGTTASGDDQSGGFSGAWRLYVSYTYDGGVSWTTVDVTGADPVQKGCISLAGVLGGTCSQRNLLDFIDAAITEDGRVVVAYADGCVGTCVTGTGASRSADLKIALQSGGKTLFSAYD